jgi:hypothetical protein
VVRSFGSLSVFNVSNYSLNDTVAIVAGTILPYLAARDHRLLKPESEKVDEDSESDSDDEDRELTRIQEMVRQWKAEAAREGRPLRLPTSESYLFVCLHVSTLNSPSSSAVHASKYLDVLAVAVWGLDVHDFLHQSSLAGKSSCIAYFIDQGAMTLMSFFTFQATVMIALVGK